MVFVCVDSVQMVSVVVKEKDKKQVHGNLIDLII